MRINSGHNFIYLKDICRCFGNWRGSRPFSAGLLTMLSGVPILYVPYAHLAFGQLTIWMSTTAGADSSAIGALLVTLGLTMWFQSSVRVFAGVAAIVLALLSIPLSNLGGFLIGHLLALLGAALSIAWAPGEPGHHHEGPASARRLGP